MNVRILGTAMWVGWVFIIGASGQELAPRAPAPPWLAAEPAAGVWTMTFSTEAEKEAAAGDPSAGGRIHPRAIVTTVQSGTRCEIADFGNGASSENWEVDGVRLQPEASNPRNILVFERPADPSGLGGFSPQALGFQAFGWLSGGDYAGMEDFQGARCHHFRSADGLREAWISADTLLPVAIRQGSLLGRYAFRSAPAATLALPAEFHGALLRHREFAARLRRLERDLAR